MVPLSGAAAAPEKVSIGEAEAISLALCANTVSTVILLSRCVGGGRIGWIAPDLDWMEDGCGGFNEGFVDRRFKTSITTFGGCLCRIDSVPRTVFVSGNRDFSTISDLTGLLCGGVGERSTVERSQEGRRRRFRGRDDGATFHLFEINVTLVFMRHMCISFLIGLCAVYCCRGCVGRSGGRGE